MCQGDNATKIDSVIFAFHTRVDEKLYVERWPLEFPKPRPASSVPAGPGPAASVPAGSVPAGTAPAASGPAASVPSAAAPDKKRSASASVASAGTTGGQSKKTRHGMAAAGVQPTPATTDRMYMVLEAPEDADGPSRGPKRTFAAMQERHGQEGPERRVQQAGDGAARMLSFATAVNDSASTSVRGPGMRTCRAVHCRKDFVGSKRQPCPHCGWRA